MAFSIADRVKETTATTGTGTYTLAGAVEGFESFASIGNGNTTYYVCTDGTDFEVGIGTYTASGTTLARTTILQSTNADTAVNWGAGNKDVFVSLPAEKAVVEDDAGDTNIGNLVVTGSHDLRVSSVVPSGLTDSIAIGSGTISCPSLTGSCGSVAVGTCALYCGVFSGKPVAIGQCAGSLASAGFGVFVGACSAYKPSTGSGPDVAVGYLAGYCTPSGGVHIGFAAGAASPSACCSVLIGREAGRCGTLNHNVAIGFQALQCRNSMASTVAIGCQAGRANISTCFTQIGNVFIGTIAGCGARSNNAVYIGNAAGAIVAGTASEITANNIGIGYRAHFLSGGCDHTFVGACAGYCMCTSTNDHTYIGYLAGSALQNTNSNNIAIGYSAGACLCATGYIGLRNLGSSCSNMIVMGNCFHSCAVIKVGWTTVSDCRDKSCVCDIPHGLDFVRALSPKEYRFKTKGRYKDDVEDKKRYGFLAQDVLTLEGDNPVIINDENPDLLVYHESHMVPVLVNAIKELADKVQTLEELVNA